MSGTAFLRSAWVWEPSVLIGCALAAGAHWRFANTSAWRRWAFGAGLVLLLLALVSPLDVLSDSYLFSAHMAQHLILVLLVSSLLVLGLPSTWAGRVEAALTRWLPGRVVFHPVFAWMLSVAALLFWHVPALYDLAVRLEPIHVLQHLTFLASGVLFWWVVADPASTLEQESRLSPWAAVVYLFSASAAGSVLGIVLTFSPTLLYSAYLQSKDEFGIAPLLRERLRLYPLADQQLGGVLMWVVGGSFYLLPIVAVFARWVSRAEADEAPVEVRPPVSGWSA